MDPKRGNRLTGFYLIVLLVILTGLIAYSTLRFVTDGRLYRSGWTACQDNNFDLAYQSFNQVSRSLHLLDLGNYQEYSRTALIACASKENWAAQVMVDSGQYKSAFAAFQSLALKSNQFNIGKYGEIARLRMMSAFQTMVASIGTLYSRGECQQLTVDGQWELDHAAFLDPPANTNILKNQMSMCADYLSRVENFATNSPRESAESIVQFISGHPDDPLSKHALQHFVDLIDTHGYEKVSSLTTCNYLKNNAAERPEALEVDYLFYCGNVFETSNHLVDAIDLYGRFITDFSSDSRYQNVVDSLADLLIADAKTRGAGTLPPPQIAGTVQNGTSAYEIQNDTKYVLRLVFSGPEKRIVTVPPCKDCTDFETAPVTCPTTGPVATASLEPGTYSVLVETVNYEGVTPFVGEFELGDGTLYSSCFFVVVSQR